MRKCGASNYFSSKKSKILKSSTMSKESLYTITAPGVIRPDSEYQVIVSLHKSAEPCTIKINLKGSTIDDTKTIEVKPYSTELLRFTIPANIVNYNYVLSAEGVSGIQLNESSKIIFDDKTYSIFIQTDKATYKPGDLVQFRVLFLDKLTCPWNNKEKPIDVLIYDCSKNRIKQFKDVQLNNGVFSGQLQLSEFPLLGEWKIEVDIQGSNKMTKMFNIDKYVLPKFEVSINAPKDICIDDPICATIHAKYTYGKPLKGKAVVSIESPSVNNFYNNKKTVPIDGTAYIEFKKENISSTMDRLNNFVESLKIVAVVEEELTGIQLSGSTNINLHGAKYTFSAIDSDFRFTHGKPFNFKVSIKNLDGSPVQKSDNLVILTAEHSDEGKTKCLFKSKVNEHGIANFELIFTDKKITSYSIKANYNNIESYIGTIYSSESFFIPNENVGSFFKANVITNNPTLNDDVVIEVNSNKHLDYFFYQVSVFGEIVQNGKIQLAEKCKTTTFKIKPTKAMKAQANLLVHYIDEGKLVFAENTIIFNQFENSIKLEAPEQVTPGEDIKLSIKTNKNSFVGLMGVDQSVLLLNDGNDITEDQIFDDLRKYDKQISKNYSLPGNQGLIYWTNAEFDSPLFIRSCAKKYMMFCKDANFESGMQNMLMSSASADRIVPVRKNFVETWIWDTFNVDSESENLSISKKVPDTITSWIVTGFSINPQTGFALTEGATKMRVFQPFFVSVNLPYSVRRGEIISIPIVVFNYMEASVDASITLDNTENEFEFTQIMEGKNQTKTVTIEKNAGKSIAFEIRPNKVGNILLKVLATSPLAGDTVHQILKVEPEGVTEYVNKAFLINLNDKEEQAETIDIDIPKDAVPNSEYVEVSVVGDLLGPTIQNLDQLVRLPCGCGEQTMVNFVPNVLVLEYLTSIGMLSPTIEAKAKSFLEIGYQRELTYKHENGSYSAFGKSDKSGSTWLTAYVARSFHQASKFIEIENKILDNALSFLASTQNEDGSFSEKGKLFDFNPINDGKNLSLTAFVLLAFLENSKLMRKYQITINRAVELLCKNSEKCDELYAMAICAYALQKSQNNTGPKILTKLKEFMKSEGDRSWWTMSKIKRNFKKIRISNVDVELTSYILLALLEDKLGDPMETMPVVKWLISQRNCNGGFQSTQDTVMGLQSLIKFAENNSSKNNNMVVNFRGEDESSHDTISVNSENSLLLQTHELPSNVRKIEVTAKGAGSALLQVSYKFNMAKAEKDARFNIEPIVEKGNNPIEIKLNISASFIPVKDDTEISNMAVMEVTLPSGYIADASVFESLMNIDLIKRIETNNGDSCIVIYFDHLTKNKTTLTILAIKSHDIHNLKPSPIVVYDYYDNEKRGLVYYSI